MARRIIKKISAKKSLKKEAKNGIFGGLNFKESYVSLISGAIVVLVVVILFFSFAKGISNMQTSSTSDSSDAESESNKDVSSTYTINPGDNLWSISENVYNDGYLWVEIAKENKLENPALIHAGNKLVIPPVAKDEQTSVIPTISPKIEDKMDVGDSIKGNTYKIKSGDNLWDIAVRAYGDGYKWAEIAKVNNLKNPDLIHSDNVLKLPR